MPQKRVYLEINKMKRGKPHKRETQILVEELFEEKWISKPSSHSWPIDIKFKETLGTIKVLGKDKVGVETFLVWLIII